MTRPLVVGMGWFPQQPGGLNRYVADLRDALAEEGESEGEAATWLLAGSGSSPPDVQLVAPSTAPLPRRIAAFSRAARRARTGADVLDCHFAPYALGPVAITARNVPLVVHFHGPWAAESLAAGESGLGPWAKRRVERYVYRRATASITESAAFRQVLTEQYGVSPWGISVVRPTVDLERFCPGDRAAARAHLGLPDTGFVAVVVRRLVARMGIDQLLRAWAEVDRSADDVLVVVGDGAEREALEALATTLDLGPAVRFLGRVDDDDLVLAYQAADLSIVPTVALEGFGLIVLESLAAGTPVLTTDNGGLAETVRPFADRLVVPAGDRSAMVACISELRRGPAWLPGPEQCRRYAGGFDAPSFARRNLEVYRSAVRPPPRRRRVVWLDHTAERSGGELAMLRQTAALRSQVHVVFAADGPVVGEMRMRGVSVEVLPMGEQVRGRTRQQSGPAGAVRSALPLAAHVVALARRLRSLDPDVVHTNSLKAALYGGLAGRLAGVPVVWHVRDRLADDYLPAGALRIVRAALARLPAAVICNSDETAAALPPGPTPVFVIPSPIDPPLALGAAPGPGRRVGVVGRLAEWKGQDLFLDALAEVATTADVHGVVVGGAVFDDDRAFAETLHQRADEADLRGRVTFAGHVDDVRPELGALDLVVHTSRIPEPFGQVVVEAMAAGRPVLVPDQGGPAAIVEDGVTGLHYRMGDVGELAAGIRRLLDDPTLAEALGERGRSAAEAYLPEALVDRVEHVYDVVAGP